MQTLTLEKKTALQEIGTVLLATLIICLTGYIYIPLWFTPVPIALQNSTVLLMAGLLGFRRAVASVSLYLFLGVVGLPVFSEGCSGLQHIIGTNGGYFFGYLIASFVVGKIAERKKTVFNVALALALGNLTVYFFGAGYLSTFVGLKNAIFMGIAPFLMGDFFKTILSVKLMQSNWKRQVN